MATNSPRLIQPAQSYQNGADMFAAVRNCQPDRWFGSEES